MKRLSRVVLPLVLMAMFLSGCGKTPAQETTPKPAAVPQAQPAAPQPAQNATAKPAGEPVKVRVGNLRSASDAGIYVAVEQGYFKEQGIEIEFTPFDSAAKMIAPLGAGQLDVGGGAFSAGLLNAISRGINLRIVADKGRNPKGFGYQALLVSKQNADKLRQPADFKGKKLALPSLGISTEAAWNHWLKAGGLTTKDVELVEMPFPDMGAGLSNGAIDAAISIEPFVTVAATKDMGVILQRQEVFYPEQQVAVLMFSEQFAQRRDVAERFVLAYVKALRDYNDAFRNKDPQKREKVIQILMKSTTLKDRAQYDKVVMPGLDPNGGVSRKAMEEDQEYFLWSKAQEKPVNFDKVIDPSFVQKAVAQLGEYKD